MRAGFNVETVKNKQMQFTVWDVGGQESLRQLWHHYFHGCVAVIFVVDSSARERFEDAKEELDKILDNKELKGAVLLVRTGALPAAPERLTVARGAGTARSSRTRRTSPALSRRRRSLPRSTCSG